MALDLRLRLHKAEGFCVSLDSEAAILLRDALYDDASHQSSSEACDLIGVLLDDESEAPERTISFEVAADLMRGIDRVSELYGARPALIELRDHLRRVLEASSGVIREQASSANTGPAENLDFQPANRVSAAQAGRRLYGSSRGGGRVGRGSPSGRRTDARTSACRHR